VRACGLGETVGVFPLFLHICRRAADNRLYRREHPEAAALVLPTDLHGLRWNHGRRGAGPRGGLRMKICCARFAALEAFALLVRARV
jgi:hypothetical protein